MIRQVVEKRLKQCEAAARLGLSVRQVRRLDGGTEGAEPVPVEDEKTVRLRVERAKAEQRARPAWKPAPDHPWRRPINPAAEATAG